MLCKHAIRSTPEGQSVDAQRSSSLVFTERSGVKIQCNDLLAAFFLKTTLSDANVMISPTSQVIYHIAF